MLIRMMFDRVDRIVPGGDDLAHLAGKPRPPRDGGDQDDAGDNEVHGRAATVSASVTNAS